MAEHYRELKIRNQDFAKSRPYAEIRQKIRYYNYYKKLMVISHDPILHEGKT